MKREIYATIYLVCSITGLFYRIAGGTDFYGRVEISVDGVWGSLCRNYWDARDAHVLCKQLGFATGEATFESFPGGEGPVWEGNLRCDRSDASLDKCSHEGWRQVQSFSSCANHKRDAGVFCYSSGTDK